MLGMGGGMPGMVGCLGLGDAWNGGMGDAWNGGMLGMGDAWNGGMGDAWNGGMLGMGEMLGPDEKTSVQCLIIKQAWKVLEHIHHVWIVHAFSRRGWWFLVRS